jgi:hypothetical protein
VFDVVGWSHGTYIYQYGPHDRTDCICAGGGGWNMVLGQAKADSMRLYRNCNLCKAAHCASRK